MDSRTKGDTVTHPQYGNGVCVEDSFQGAIYECVRVLFANGDECLVTAAVLKTRYI